MTLQTVSVIVPCRNERAYIEPFCASLFAQALPAGWQMQAVVADGQSDDGTAEWLAARAAADPRLRVIDNPGRIVSTGLNAAIAAARGEVVVRMDVHTSYAPDYIALCAQVLAETGADCVGGAWRPVGEGAIAHAACKGLAACTMWSAALGLSAGALLAPLGGGGRGPSSLRGSDSEGKTTLRA